MSSVATHYPELKTFAHATPGVVNASLEFDVHSLRPTYRLTLGLPGRSNALLIAERLGLDRSVIEKARAQINPEDLRADRLLDDIRKERNRTSRERQKLEKARKHAAGRVRELEAELAQTEQVRLEARARARAEGELEVAVLRQNIETLKARLKKARQPLDAVRDIEDRAQELEAQIEAPVEIPRPAAESTTGQPFSLGERVFVSELKSSGVITALTEVDAEVQVGTLRVRAKLVDLQHGKGMDSGPGTARRPGSTGVRTAEAPSRGGAKSSVMPRTSPGLEVSLRGRLVDDGLLELDRYLERAYGAGLPFVRIIHGKGTGRMRDAVRAALKDHPYVDSFEEGGENEGGAGVTIARLARG
jgi:DNA mismatch repair protein MutS2